VAVTPTTHLAEHHANKMHTWSPLIKWQASSLREEACWRPGNEQREREVLEARDYKNNNNNNNNNSPVTIRGKSDVQRNLTRRAILYRAEKIWLWKEIIKIKQERQNNKYWREKMRSWK